MSPKKVDHNERRRTLAASAATLIAEKGAHSVKMTDVASHAGCTTGSIVYYFSNKDELWFAACQHAYTMQMERLQGALETLTLKEMVRIILPMNEDQQAGWRLSISLTDYALWNRKVTEAFQPMTEALEQRMKVMINDSIRLGFLPKDTDLELTAFNLYAWIDGLAAQAIQDPARWPPEKQEAALQHFFSLLGWKDSPDGGQNAVV